MLNEEEDERLKAIEAEIDSATRIRVVAMVNLYGMKYFELRMEQQHPDDPKKWRYLGSPKFPLSEAKSLEITKTLNGSKKMGAWLATEEGLQYAKDRHKDYWRRHFRDEAIRRIRWEKQKEEQVNG
jgi:hypothetical protein